MSEAGTVAERKAVMERYGVDYSTVSHYRQTVSTHDSRLKREREPLTARRLRGGGRPTKLSNKQETEIDEWITAQRKERLRVTEKRVQQYVREKYGVPASNHWMQGFMQRRDWSMRLRTTDKDVNTGKVRTWAVQFRNKVNATFSIKSHALIFNMDETPLYLDAPGNRTLEKKGAKSVEIASTKHEKQRFTAVLCVSCSGAIVNTLLIHRSTDKTRKKKVNNLFQHTISVNDKQVKLWVSYSPKAYMNQDIMEKWISDIYKEHLTVSGHELQETVLFMDNMGAHDTEEIENACQRHQLPTCLFPPNCTPLLQPLDHSINAILKQGYEEEWCKWHREVGRKRLTKHGNVKKPTESDLNRWVAAALQRITPELIRKSWRHTLLLRPNLMRLPTVLWDRIVSFLPPDQCEAVEELRADRALYDGSRFIFPQALNKRKRARSGGEEEGGEQTKRRRDDERRIATADDARAAVEAALSFFPLLSSQGDVSSSVALVSQTR
jgi:transposase